jgi:hypothetical protein
MIIKDLDNNKVSWSITGCISNSRLQNKSDLHLLARSLIHEIYPTLQVLEEVPIPVRRSETLYLDFYLPLIKKCIEVHGEQHYKFVQFYHQNVMGFVKSKKRDEDKQNWCVNNGISYIALPFDTTTEWKELISNA